MCQPGLAGRPALAGGEDKAWLATGVDSLVMFLLLTLFPIMILLLLLMLLLIFLVIFHSLQVQLGKNLHKEMGWTLEEDGWGRGEVVRKGEGRKKASSREEQEEGRYGHSTEIRPESSLELEREDADEESKEKNRLSGLPSSSSFSFSPETIGPGPEWSPTVVRSRRRKRCSRRRSRKKRCIRKRSMRKRCLGRGTGGRYAVKRVAEERDA